MNRQSSRTDLNENSIESDRSYPPTKRHCPSPSLQRSLSNSSSSVLAHLTPGAIDGNRDGCKSCGKQERLLRTFNCPSLHCFCLNCIFSWTQTHVQNKTPPKCLVLECEYLLKVEDLDDLPIAMKDHQILLRLVKLTIGKPANNLRRKCDKCDLYIDQHNLYTHQNECLGRSLTIPCETCYCPVSITDYEGHTLVCNNEDNYTLVQFLRRHLQDANATEKDIKAFISAWQRKFRQPIDVYELIEEFNKGSSFSDEPCGACKRPTPYEQLYFINCINNHSSCALCYRQHIENQMNNSHILTCNQCDYHLQDKDLTDTRIFLKEQITLYQAYQNKKVLEVYHQWYGTDDDAEDNPTAEPPIPTTTATTTATTTVATASTHADTTARRICEVCSTQQSYGDIFVLNCNCKICYDCFAKDVNRQRQTTNELLLCALCRTSIKRNDLANLRLPPGEIDAIQLYQQGKLFEFEHAIHFSNRANTEQTTADAGGDNDFDLAILLVNQQQCLPKYWSLPMLENFARHPLDPQSTEFKFVADKFQKSWTHSRNQHQTFAAQPVAPIHSPAVPVNFQGFRPVAYPPYNRPSNPAAPPTQSISMQPMSQMYTAPPPVAQPVANRFHGPPPPAHQAIPFLPYPPQYPPSTSMIPTARPVSAAQMLAGGIYQSTPVPRLPPPPLAIQPQNPSSTTMLFNHRQPTTRVRQVRREDHEVSAPNIIQIERVQNQRWFKQYSAHDFEFRQKLGKQTEQWLFHGCDEKSSKNIEVECFNRSYAGQHAVAFGQGCYFARESAYSHKFAVPDRQGVRRMFLARVLVGKTAQGNSSMRVPPAGYDTTGDGNDVFVTYHDSQAYAEYLITYR